MERSLHIQPCLPFRGSQQVCWRVGGEHQVTKKILRGEFLRRLLNVYPAYCSLGTREHGRPRMRVSVYFKHSDIFRCCSFLESCLLKQKKSRKRFDLPR